MNINKKSFSIYKITCTINNKVYIGQTSGTLKHRFYQHVNKESGCIKLKRAIEKYGKENFTIEEIDIASDKETALQKEAHYIKQYKSNNIKYGYNILANGYSSYSTKKVYCIETKETFETVLLAAKVMNVCPSFMAAVCRGNKSTVRGLHFTYCYDIEREPYNAKKIICVETGKVFNSLIDASRVICKDSSALSVALKKPHRTCGGFHWKYL